MKKKIQINNLFDNLKVSPQIEEIFEKEVAETDKASFDIIQKYLVEIKRSLEQTLMKHSEILPKFVLLLLVLEEIKPKEGHLEETKDSKILGGLLDICAKLKQKSSERYNESSAAFQEMVNTISNHPKIAKSNPIKFNINVQLISSVFGDYYLLKDLKQIISRGENDFTLEFRQALQDFKAMLLNVSNLDKEDWGKIQMTKLRSHKTGLQVSISSDEIKKNERYIELFDEISKVVFTDTLTRNHLKEFLKHMDAIEDEMEFNFVFKRMATVFRGEDRLSKRSKKLLLHEIFKIYKHPLSISDTDEENYLSKDASSIETSEKRKIRVIQILIPNLE